MKTLRDWPNCEVPDCPNKACLRLDSDKCYPHTMDPNAPMPKCEEWWSKADPDMPLEELT